MKQVLYILLAVLLTGGTSLLVGNALLRATRATFARTEAMFVSLVIGAGVLAGAVFALTAMGQGRKSVFLIAAAILAASSVWRGGFRFPTAPGAPASRWDLAFWLIYGVYAVLYLPAALTPESSIDGTAYYLSHVSRFAETFTGMIPDGAEALFLFAYSIGKGSAVATVVFLFLLALPLAIRAYAGNERTGTLVGILVFASPIVAATGTIAAPDVLIAAIAFALFLAIEKRAWPAAGMLFVFLAWTISPWIEREFAKPLLHLRSWHGRVPINLAVGGKTMNGLLGPVFLLLPVIFLCKQRRWLLAAFVFAIPALGGLEARVFIPALPFFALALASVLVEIPLAAPAVLAGHAIFSWPWFLNLYVNDPLLRFPGQPPAEIWSAALRIEPEDRYLHRTMDAYSVGILLEHIIPDGERALALTPFQTIYHTRRIVNDRRLQESLASPTPEKLHALREEGILWLIVPPGHPAVSELLSRADEWNLQLRLFDRGYVVFQIAEIH